MISWQEEYFHQLYVNNSSNLKNNKYISFIFTYSGTQKPTTKKCVLLYLSTIFFLGQFRQFMRSQVNFRALELKLFCYRYERIPWIAQTMEDVGQTLHTPFLGTSLGITIVNFDWNTNHGAKRKKTNNIICFSNNYLSHGLNHQNLFL